MVSLAGAGLEGGLGCYSTGFWTGQNLHINIQEFFRIAVTFLQNCKVVPLKSESANLERCFPESRKCSFHGDPAFLSVAAWSPCGGLGPPLPDQTSVNTALTR